MCLAIPGQIVEIVDEETHIAMAEVSGVRRNVNVGLLAEGEDAVGVGDWVLIHVGFAMSKISAEEAQEQLRLLDTLGETEAVLEEVQGYGAAADPYDPLGENPFADDAAGNGSSEQTSGKEP